MKKLNITKYFLLFINRSKAQLFTLFLILFSSLSYSQTSFKTLNYLYSISGNHTVAGQHNKEPNSDPDKWTEWIKATTGNYPGLWSGDMLFASSDINARWTMTYEAKEQWDAGAMVNIMWHACNPVNMGPCSWSGGVQTTLSDPQWNELITNGTNLNNRWKAMMDDVAQYLQYLEDNGVEVLWRPLHEQNQGIFWWAGRPGANGSKKLWQITYDYMKYTKGLSNLIWVWDIQDFGSLTTDLNNYNPGSNYYDVAALDIYEGFATWKYNAMVNFAGSKPIAVGECDVLPTASRLAAEPKWTFFMGWAELTQERNSVSAIQNLYWDGRVIVREEMPGWSGGVTCTTYNVPSTIQAESYCNMSGVQTENTSDTGGGQNVGWIETNDWMTYSVNVPSAGSYTVQYRVASDNANGSIRLERGGGSMVFGTISVPNTGGWQNWQTISHTVQLPAGTQDIAIVAATGGFNINWMGISSSGGGSINLAYNRPVTTSSNENATNTGAKAVDANGTTRWSSAYANNQNFIVDLGARYNISRIKIAWEAAYAADYQLQISTDNVNWTNIKEVWGKSSSATDDHTGLSGTARYVKAYCINRATVYGFSFFEFEVYGSYIGARLGEDEINEGKAVIFPNPAMDKVRINLTGQLDGESKITLTNHSGKVLLTEKNKGQEHILNIADLPLGLYFITVSNSKDRKVYKMFKR
ncbi:MAG TPA: carbohydrate-binding protein [Cytophagales bacterium]|nr:carbohydrate-binding protein [Cytophagales bacterium]